MKKLFPLLLFLVLTPCAHGQMMSMSETEPSHHSLYDSSSNSNSPRISISRSREIRDNDRFLALVPGAVQMRRKWPAIAGTIWGGMAITGGLAIYEQFHIVKLQNDMDNDPSNANWYDEKIRKSKKIRNGSLIALGGIYIANYVSALLLPDRDPRTSWISLYAAPQGGVGLTYALKF